MQPRYPPPPPGSAGAYYVPPGTVPTNQYPTAPTGGLMPPRFPPPPGSLPPGLYGIPMPPMAPRGYQQPGISPMPMPGMPLMPMPLSIPGMLPGFMHPPRPMIGAPPLLVPGAPGFVGGMMPPVPQMIPVGVISAAPSSGPPPGWTPSLATTVPPNAFAGAPLTLYIGKIPSSLSDEIFKQIIECCGKVTKWSRPTDIHQELKRFGFCTFEHGVSALRCKKVLNGLDLSKYCPDAEHFLQVKAGTKETEALNSLLETEKAIARANAGIASAKAAEQEGPQSGSSTAEQQQQEEDSGDKGGVAKAENEGTTEAIIPFISDADIAVTEKILAILAPLLPEATTNIDNNDDSPDAVDESVTVVANGVSDSVEAFMENYLEKTSAAAATAAAIVSTMSSSQSLLEITERDEDDPEREKLVMSEIEKFRQRQILRDKELEVQRKKQLRERIQTLKDKQERERKEAERNAALAAKGVKSAQAELKNHSSSAPVITSGTSNVSGGTGHVRGDGSRGAWADSAAGANAEEVGDKKRGAAAKDLSEEELQAKKRRREEVLEMLAGESGIAAGLSLKQREAEADAAAAAAKINAPIKLSTAGTAMTKQKVGTTSGLFNADDPDEAARANRRLIPLDISEAERQAAMLYKAPEDEEAEERLVQAQKQAQAISAALAKTIAGISASVSSAVPGTVAAGGAGSAEASKTLLPSSSSSAKRGDTKHAPAKLSEEEQYKLRQKELVDRIPADKDALFAYEMDWTVIDKKKIIENTMRVWIGKKIVEYLGEEEVTLTEFIINKLKGHCKPSVILEELRAVLDDEAMQFTIKLWRMLVYSMLKSSDM